MMIRFQIPCLLALLALPAIPAPGQSPELAQVEPPRQGETFMPDDVDLEHPIYETSFDDPAVLRDWSREGGLPLGIANGNLLLESDPADDLDHMVVWLRREVPADFLLEFTLRPHDRHRGLAIVFFTMRGVNGESVFDPSLQKRDGTFKQYHSGDLKGYHVSYWSGERAAAHIRKHKGHHLVAKGADLVREGPAGAFQTIRIYKRGGKIRLMVDDVVALAYDDDGKAYGPVHTHPGWIALRHMGRTVRTEYGHLKVYPLKR